MSVEMEIIVERRILDSEGRMSVGGPAQAHSLHRLCCAASADEWGKIGQEAAREAIKATLEGSGGWAQRLQDIAKHASATEIAIRQTMQHNAPGERPGATTKKETNAD